MPAERPPKRVSPSTIARYYFHECERFLRYVATPTESRAAEGIPLTPYDTSPVTHAILDSGYAWEEEVVGRHLRHRAEIALADGAQPVRDRVHSVEASRRLISNLRPGHYVYQPTLQVPASFYERYAIDSSVVVFANCRPDLIECYEDESAAKRLRIIDVKASPDSSCRTASRRLCTHSSSSTRSRTGMSRIAESLMSQAFGSRTRPLQRRST